MIGFPQRSPGIMVCQTNLLLRSMQPHPEHTSTAASPSEKFLAFTNCGGMARFPFRSTKPHFSPIRTGAKPPQKRKRGSSGPKKTGLKLGGGITIFPFRLIKATLFITYFAAMSNTHGRELFKLVELDRPDIGEWIEREWLTIPPEYFKKGNRGLRNALVNNLYEVNFLLSQRWSHFTTDFFCYPERSQRVQLIGNR